MTIVLTGGGTGGHITPILAVAHEIKQQNPRCKVVYIGERRGKFAHITKDNPDIDQIYTIFAGKFRRYYRRSVWAQLKDVKTNLQNARDFFYFCIGTVQSWRILFRLKPDAVFLKGGFVGVPVGIAAAVRGLPYITHDSDAVAGLANKLVSRWALYHATALPAKNYSYSRMSVKPVGVIVSSKFVPIDKKLKSQAKKAVKIPDKARVLLVTGGSSGAVRINQAVSSSVPRLLEAYPRLVVVHQTGKGKANIYGRYRNPRLRVLEFLKPMDQYTAAADVVVCRGSGNTLAELGVQGKAAVVIPHPKLTAGHQLKNAELLTKKKAALVVHEAELYKLEKSIRSLLDNEDKRLLLARNLQSMTKDNAAQSVASLLLRVADKHDIEG